MPSKSSNGTEILLSKDPTGNTDLEVLDPRKVRYSFTCYSPGISCSSFDSYPPIPLVLKETAWSLKPPTTPSASSGPCHCGLLLSLCAMWLATQREGNAQHQHLLINHYLVETLLNAKLKATITLTTSISCY